MIEITVEVWPGLSGLFGDEPSRRWVLDMPVPDATTLAGLIAELRSRYPTFDAHVTGPPQTQPSEAFAVAINGRLPELMRGWETPLHHGDRVVLVPPYAGG